MIRTRCSGRSSAAEVRSDSGAPMRNSPGEIRTRSIPREFVTRVGNGGVGEALPGLGGPVFSQPRVAKRIKDTASANRTSRDGAHFTMFSVLQHCFRLRIVSVLTRVSRLRNVADGFQRNWRTMIAANNSRGDLWADISRVRLAIDIVGRRVHSTVPVGWEQSLHARKK